MGILKKSFVSFYRHAELAIYPIVRSLTNTSGRVLIYHNISPNESRTFEEQIKYIANNYNVVTAGDFINLTKEVSSDNENACAITFDDGFGSVMKYAIPILERYGIKATIFINYNLYKLTENNDSRRLNFYCDQKFPRLYSNSGNCLGLTRNDIQYLIRYGHEIGAHTINHPNLTLLSNDQLEYELNEPINCFRNEFDYKVELLAYPYGRRLSFNNTIVQKVKDAGYRAAFSGISRNPGEPGAIDFFKFPRTSVSLDWSQNYFKTIFTGSEDRKDFFSGQYRS